MTESLDKDTVTQLCHDLPADTAASGHGCRIGLSGVNIRKPTKPNTIEIKRAFQFLTVSKHLSLCRQKVA